jgi:hypothetical protein
MLSVRALARASILVSSRAGAGVVAAGVAAALGLVAAVAGALGLAAVWACAKLGVSNSKRKAARKEVFISEEKNGGLYLAPDAKMRQKKKAGTSFPARKYGARKK